MGRELHLNLEGIALEADGIEVDGLQHAAAIADEACRGVVDVQTCHHAHVLRGKVAHQHAPHRPVHHVHARDVARADGHVVAFVLAGGQQARQVGRRMAEVGVHLEDEVVAVRQRPFEARDVCGAETLLAAALHQENTAAELFRHQPLHDGGSAVGRTVVDDQNVECVLLTADHGADDVLNVLLLVVRRDDDDAVCLHRVEFLLFAGKNTAKRSNCQIIRP